MASTSVLRRIGLALTAFRFSELLRAADLRARRRNTRVRETEVDHLPLPPERLVVLVAGSPDLGWFIEGGRRAADSIRAAVGRHGAKLEEMDAVLDFGCGCGRVLRHLAGGPGPRLYGCDYNSELVEWCRHNLSPGEYATNDLAPPLRCPNGTFDLVWALSVFTHLPEELQQRWIAELRRILRPGGLLLVTTQGSRYSPQLSRAELARFERGELIVRYSEAPGTNLCSAFHPEEYIRGSFVDGFELAEFLPEGAAGNPHQDLVLLRKPND